MEHRGRGWLRGRDDDTFAVFVRGVTLGTFVGAIIAGSTIWRRARRGPSAPSGPGTGPTALQAARGRQDKKDAARS